MSLEQKLAQIKVLMMDVDGVLTDRGLYYGPEGLEMKRFDVRDGLGIVRAQEAGIQVALITGDDTPITTARAARLGIELVLQGVEDKAGAATELMGELGVSAEEVAFVGDDETDLAAFGEVGLKVAVGDAAESLKAAADVLTEHPGGRGAVREVCDAILAARGADPQSESSR
ncbi:MAG: HAD-IIIA family hydrolase [Armatimonadota bacterium]|jgi:YrbI family 3-deoxy-D-manno-octulosonate 8-phosphate phosphatase